MTEQTLRLHFNDPVRINGVAYNVYDLTETTAVFCSGDGPDIIMGLAEAYINYVEGRLVFDHNFLAHLDHGSEADRALAEKARRPFLSFKEWQCKLGLLYHFQARRMEALLNQHPRTAAGFKAIGDILVAEEKRAFAEGAPWARENPECHAGGLVKIIRIWDKTHCISALTPDGRGPAKLTDDEEDWDSCVYMIIRWCYLLNPRNSFQFVYDEYIEHAFHFLKERNPYLQIKLLSARSYERLMHEWWSPSEIALFRGNKKKLKKHTPILTINDVAFPFQRVEFDSTELDWRVYFWVGALLKWIRPWITFAIDVRTRLILGLWISWDAPSYESTRQVFLQVFWPKDERTRRGTVSAWPSGILKPQPGICAGSTAVVDNGSAFDSHAVHAAAQKSHIELVCTPPYSPDSKPHVERFLGNYAVPLAVELLAASSYASYKDKIFDSEEEARDQLATIILDITNRSVDWYNTKYHRGINAIPLELFEELSVGRLSYPDIADKIYFGAKVDVRVDREGAHAFGQTYRGEGLGPVLDRAKNRGATYCGHVEFGDGGRLALLDHLSRPPVFINLVAKNFGAVSGKSVAALLAEDEKGRKARRKRSEQAALERYNAHKARDARRPEILAQIHEDLAAHGANLAAVASFKRLRDTDIADADSDAAPAPAPPVVAIAATGPTNAFSAADSPVVEDEPETGLLDELLKDGDL